MAGAKQLLGTVAEAISSARGAVRGRRTSADAPSPPPSPEDSSAPAPPQPASHRRSRGGRRHRKGSPAEPSPSEASTTGAASGTSDPSAAATEEGAEAPPAVAEAVTESSQKAKRRRGSRGGRKHHRKATASPEAESAPLQQPAAEPQEAPPRETDAARGRSRRRRGASQPEVQAEASAPTKEADERPKTRARRRGSKESGGSVADAAAPKPRVKSGAVPPRARIPVTGAPTQVPPPFAHNAEYEFARILDFYGIDWQYEPRSFPLRWEYGHVTEAFTPDFYLPDFNLYVELTTMKPSLTAEKDRKMRLLRELYPEINIILLKRRDYLRLLAKYGYGPLTPDQIPDISKILIPAAKLQKRVAQLGAQISRDYAGKEPVLIGVLRGVICFMADLMRHITVPCSMDLMAISSYDGNGAAAVRILKDLDENIKGKDVMLVEDIVDTGMTLNHIIEYLNTKRPASIKVCALLDKRARRIVNVPLDYVGFEIPDEFVVGYGLDFRQRFRNLEFIGILKHELLP